MPTKTQELQDEIEALEDENTTLRRQKEWYRKRLRNVVTAAVIGEPEDEEEGEDEEEDEEEEDDASNEDDEA